MSDQLPDFIRAMQAPEFYPHAVEAVELRETHISWVFLTGDTVYKINKPVDMGFLDFSTLDKRSHHCRREIELNQRMTSDIYLDVVPITREEDGYALDGAGGVVETAVRMRQLDASDAMDRRLRDGCVDPASIEALACKLARFYDHAESGPAIDRFGACEVIEENCMQNFRQIAELPCTAVDGRLQRMIEAVTRGFLANRSNRFAERVKNGRIKDCHGDLRPEHIYLTADGIQVIDCIAFNRRLRYGDAAGDLAFLAMALDAQGHPRTAAALAASFAFQAADFHLFSVLDFYKCYRAMVRIKVECLRLNQSDSAGDISTRRGSLIRRYERLAYRYALRFSKPTLWVVFGQVATGKSTMARALGDALDISIIRSDEVRKQIFDATESQSQVVAFGEGIYTSSATALTYGHLLRQAQAKMQDGQSVIVDATFSRRRQRREARRLADTVQGEIFFVHCRCPESTIRQRLRARSTGSGISDARIDHLAQLEAAFEPADELQSAEHLRVDTERPPEENLQRLFTHHALV